MEKTFAFIWPPPWIVCQKKMDTIRHDFNRLRFLIYNLKTEINICTSYYREYIIFLHNISIKPEFSRLYHLVQRKKFPIRVSDARQTPDGRWISDTQESVKLIKKFLIDLYNYGPRLYNYICLLYQETQSLITGLEEYRQRFHYCLEIIN